MKTTMLFLAHLLSISVVYSSSQMIVCGTQPGEIYFVAPVENMYYHPGFYYSDDFGQTIVLRDTVPDELYTYGLLLADAGDETLFLFYQPPVISTYQLTTDGGNHWSIYGSMQSPAAFTGGVIPGELYKTTDDLIYKLERSSVYYNPFVRCSSQGLPDTVNILGLALGDNPGEVYIHSTGHLYYSSDFAENFSDQGNIDSLGVYVSSVLLNGTSPGEIYAFHFPWRTIWRISQYGDSVACVANFTSLYGLGWDCSAATGRQPGELYFMAFREGTSSGGLINIHHSTNYGQSWDMYEHDLLPSGIESGYFQPSDLQLSIFPNPFNESTVINFELPAAGEVELGIFDIFGRYLQISGSGATPTMRYFPAGFHRITFDGSDLTSGVYIFRLNAGNFEASKKMVLVK